MSSLFSRHSSDSQSVIKADVSKSQGICGDAELKVQEHNVQKNNTSSLIWLQLLVTVCSNNTTRLSGGFAVKADVISNSKNNYIPVVFISSPFYFLLFITGAQR